MGDRFVGRSRRRPTGPARRLCRRVRTTTDALRTHAKKLRKALLRIDDGSMRPGPWCTTCPARDDCPTQNNDLLARSSTLVGLANKQLLLPEVTAENVGHLHLLIAEFNRLEKPTKEAIRAWVRAHPEVEATREDGKVLRFISKGYTNLSQASILRAYGKKAGERLIKKLKKDGAIEEGKREELWAINDK